MTRRAFFTAALGLAVARPAAARQFVVTGHFDLAGLPGEGYFSLGQSAAIMLNPEKLPSMVKQAEQLVGKTVELRLQEAS
jgi:hypothetical protein